MAESKLEAQFRLQLQAEGLWDRCEVEHVFHVKRRWRFDFCWPDKMIAVELEGWGMNQGHTSLEGFADNCDKYNEATRLGWRVFRFTGSMVRDGSASLYIKEILNDQCTGQRRGSGRKPKRRGKQRRITAADVGL